MDHDVLQSGLACHHSDDGPDFEPDCWHSWCFAQPAAILSHHWYAPIGIKQVASNHWQV